MAIIHNRGVTLALGDEPPTIIMSDRTVNPFPGIPGQLSVVSSSAEDAPGGDGVAAVRLWGLSETSPGHYQEFEADAMLAGTTPTDVMDQAADLTRAFRCFRIWVLEDGFAEPNGSNVGRIAVRIDGSDVAEIAPGRGSTEMACWSCGPCPARIRRWTVSLTDILGNASVRVDLRTRSFTGPWVTRATEVLSNIRSGFDESFTDPGELIQPNSDLKIEATRLAGTVDLIGSFDVWA